MPFTGNKDKGPTFGEFVIYWAVILGICILLGWYKGVLII